MATFINNKGTVMEDGNQGPECVKQNTHIYW